MPKVCMMRKCWLVTCSPISRASWQCIYCGLEYTGKRVEAVETNQMWTAWARLLQHCVPEPLCIVKRSEKNSVKILFSSLFAARFLFNFILYAKNYFHLETIPHIHKHLTITTPKTKKFRLLTNNIPFNVKWFHLLFQFPHTTHTLAFSHWKSLSTEHNLFFIDISYRTKEQSLVHKYLHIIQSFSHLFI